MFTFQQFKDEFFKIYPKVRDNPSENHLLSLYITYSLVIRSLSEMMEESAGE